MILRIMHHRLNGVRIVLIVTVAADGAVEYWRSEDPTTGAHLELPSADKWWAVSSMNRELRQMKRGAA